MLMVQTNTQHNMKPTKIKGPPPVPPRPNQSVVAEALAKTRKAVAESKANFTKSRTMIKQEKYNQTTKSKTLDRSTATNPPSVSPKQNGLARVKSFIRDVISDRSSSSDEKKSSGQNSRRSSSDSSSIPTSASNKNSNESLNSKAVKTCKQILVRSLSTSNKLDQDAKCKVAKSSSFAEKTFPLRKAPPPPLSPKPKLRPMKPLPLQKKIVVNKTPAPSPEISPYSSPVDSKPPQIPPPEAPYATVEEVQEFDDRLRNNPSEQVTNLSDKHNAPDSPKRDEIVNINNNSLERKTSRVTEMLISEILASRNNNKDEANQVIDKGKDSENMTNGNVSLEIEMMKDMSNHDMLIYELQTMRSQTNVPDGLDFNENEYVEKSEKCDSEDSEQNYAMSSESSEQTDDGYDQAYAYILDDDLKSRLRKQFRAISTMSLQGLPPLPKSLSGFADGEPQIQDEMSPVEKPPTDLDSQLAYLKKEMILTALSFYATGSYQKPVGMSYMHVLSQASVSNVLREVTMALNHPDLLRKYIRFPQTRPERQTIINGFSNKFGIPGVLGCIDGTHVALIQPKEHPEIFFNRKLYYSRNVQIICDSDLNILNVHAIFGGAAHDAYIWKNCIIHHHMQELHRAGESVWFLGDSGYPLRPWLLTPIVNAEPGSADEHYTRVHCHARNTVERCIGVLKARWRCLLAHRTLHYDHDMVARIINAIDTGFPLMVYPLRMKRKTILGKSRLNMQEVKKQHIWTVVAVSGH